jgi:hypothetical protein
MSGCRMSFVLFSTLFLFVAAAGAAKKPSVLESTDVAPGEELRLDLDAGARLEIKGVTGRVQITRSEGTETVVRFVRAEGPVEPRFTLLRHDEGATLCVVHPSPNPKKQNECVPGRKGRLYEGSNKSWSDVAFEVAIPDGVHFRSILARGTVEANAGASDLELELIAGDITVVDGGSRVIDAKNTAAGTIDAIIAPTSMLPQKRVVRLHSSTGNVRATVPTSIPISYFISSDRPVITPWKLAPKAGAGQMGTLGPAGDPALDLTLNTALQGTIELRKP